MTVPLDFRPAVETAVDEGFVVFLPATFFILFFRLILGGGLAGAPPSVDSRDGIGGGSVLI